MITSDWMGTVSGRLADFTIGTVIVVVHVLLANRKSNFLLPKRRQLT